MDRGAVLAQYDVNFPEMPLGEKENIFKWIVAQGLKCEFDADKVVFGRPSLIRIAPSSCQDYSALKPPRVKTSEVIDAAAQTIMSKWGNKTLSMLHDEAIHDASGMAFESIRVAEGERIFLVLCATRHDDIEKLEGVFDFEGDGDRSDWQTCTLADMVLNTGYGTGLSYEALIISKGERLAIALCAANPNAVKVLQAVLTFPE